jgi:hypothetical protein
MNAGVQGGRQAAEFEVMSPWADADPVPLRGIAPRPASLAGKKIGLYSNRKRAAELTLRAVERELLERYPTAQTSWYECTTVNLPEALSEGKARFEAWVGGVDGVVLSVAD